MAIPSAPFKYPQGEAAGEEALACLLAQAHLGPEGQRDRVVLVEYLVHRLREERGGVRMGIDATYISRVEGGRINLRWATLQRFLRALDAPLADLAAEVERQERRQS